MKAYLRRISLLTGILAFCMLILFAQVSQAAVANKFAKKGTIELGGSAGFSSTTQVSNGETADESTTYISFLPFVGYFISDGFEIGFNPFGISSTSYGDESITQMSIFAAPSYNFDMGGNIYPFIELLLGYTSVSNGSSLSGISYGGRGGIKIAMTDKGLLNIGLQYLMITTNPENADKRYGSNVLSLMAGFTIWLD